MALEIERKFLVEELPEGLAYGSADEIAQGYLAVGEDEVRLRRRGDRFLLTVKRGKGMARGEVEVPIDRAAFEELWPLTKGRRVEKVRRTLPVEGGTLEVDRYDGALAGLVVAEIEFPDEAAAEAFEPPAWLSKELTGDARWSNARLALDGLPPEGR
jgi:adenylate cyclase